MTHLLHKIAAAAWLGLATGLLSLGAASLPVTTVKMANATRTPQWPVTLRSGHAFGARFDIPSDCRLEAATFDFQSSSGVLFVALVRFGRPGIPTGPAARAEPFWPDDFARVWLIDAPGAGRVSIPLGADVVAGNHALLIGTDIFGAAGTASIWNYEVNGASSGFLRFEPTIGRFEFWGNPDTPLLEIAVSGWNPLTPPIVAAEPTSLQVNAQTGKGSFRTQVVGNPAPNYRWQFRAAASGAFTDVVDGPGVSGAAAPVLELSNITLAQSGREFRCVATNTQGRAVTAIVRLQIYSPVALQSEPTATFRVGEPGSFLVRWTGEPRGTLSITDSGFPPWARWNAETGEISGTPPDAHLAPFKFKLSVGGRNSYAQQDFTLQVAGPVMGPIFATFPVSVVSTVGAEVSFEAKLVEGSAPTLRWQRQRVDEVSFVDLPEGLPYLDTATEKLTIRRVTAGMQGDRFRLTATSTAGVSVSAVATLRLPDGIFVADRTVTAGQPVLLTIQSGSPVAPRYQWRRNGVAIAGATNADFAIAAATLADADLYDVSVDSAGTTRVSNAAWLQVDPATVQTGVVFDPAFGVATERDGGRVSCLVALPDGGVIAAGDFIRFNQAKRSRLARFSADGRMDAAWRPPEIDGEVRCVARLADGALLIGGNFSRVGAVRSLFLARLKPDGTADPGFVHRGATGPVESILPFGPDTYLAAGAGSVRRVLAGGEVDRSFPSPVLASEGPVRMALAPDGSAYVGGALQLLTSEANLVRIHTTGAVSTITAVTGRVHALVAASDGSVYAALPSGVARILPTGQIDSDFSAGPLGSSTGCALALDSAGRLLGATAEKVIRLPRAGESPAEFPVLSVAALLVAGDGSLWCGGDFDMVGAQRARALVRFASGGDVPVAVGTAVERPGLVQALLPTASGGLLIAGDFTRLNDAPANCLACVDATGAVDSTFDVGTGPAGAVRQVQRLPGGRWLVAGSFASFAGQPRAGLAILAADGKLEPGFVPRFPAGSIAKIDGAVRVFGGHLVAHGALSRADNSTLAPVFRLGADGTHDATFALERAYEPASVAAMAPMLGGRVAVLGTFSTFGGKARGPLVALRSDGTVESEFKGIVDYPLVRTADGSVAAAMLSIAYREIFAAGSFDDYSHGYRRAMFGFREDGALWLSAEAEPRNWPIRGMLEAASGGLLAWHGADVRADMPVLPAIFRLERVFGRLDRSFALVGASQHERFSVCTTDDAGRIYSASLVTGRVYRTMAAVRPSIVRPPAGTVVRIGEAATLSIAVQGSPAPMLQWFRNGDALPGATGAVLTIGAAASVDAGFYRVAATNVAGELRSLPVFLAVGREPQITTAPAGLTVLVGRSAAFSVGTSSALPVNYRWRHRGVEIPGATGARLEIAAAGNVHEGDYDVLVSNSLGTTASAPVRLSVVAAASTVQLLPSGYIAGGLAAFRATIATDRAGVGLTWSFVLPAGWSFHSDNAAHAESRPVAGATGSVRWTWATNVAGLSSFDFWVRVPFDQTGPVASSAQVLIAAESTAPAVLSTGGAGGVIWPLAIHDADTDRDQRIGLVELLRVISLFNVRRGSIRSGAYSPAAAPTEDGFAPAPARLVDEILPRYHSADTNRDGRLDLTELTRVIELFNWRDDTVRSGEYRVQADTEDGFAPGPS